MHCRNCGKEQTPEIEQCPACGKNPRIGQAFCQVCGFTVNPALELCSKCGSKLFISAQSAVRVNKKPVDLTALARSAERESRNFKPSITPAAGADQTPTGSKPAGTTTLPDNPVSQKSRTYVSVLAICPGWLGIAGLHRLYLGKYISGIIMLLTVGGLLIWSLIDFISAVSGRMKDKEGKLILKW